MYQNEPKIPKAGHCVATTVTLSLCHYDGHFVTTIAALGLSSEADRSANRCDRRDKGTVVATRCQNVKDAKKVKM